MSTLVCSVFLTLLAASNGLPSMGYRYYQPGTVMLGGYYGMPPMRYPNLVPKNYDPLPAASEEFEKEALTESSVVVSDEEKELAEQSTPVPQTNEFPKAKGAVLPKKTPKRPKTKPVQDGDDSVGSNFPFGEGGSSLFNTFFPIMIGGNSGVEGKSREEGGSPGGATAIANSFSTGRGGVASSHATSFGDVYLSSALRNDRSNRKRENV